MASNQSWDDEHTLSRTCKVHRLKEVDILTAMIDLLMKKLEDSCLDLLKMVDAQVTCEECRETCHMGINCPTVCQVANFVGHSNNGYHPNQGFNAGWNKLSFSFDNRQQGGSLQNFNRSEPFLKEIIRDQLRINLEFGKKLLANDSLGWHQQ
jgi:hypothetical protein